MSEQLSAAAQAMGVPEPLVERSANAWAAAQGQSVDDVLAAWAGGEAVSTTPAPAEEPPEETEAAPAEEPEAPAEETPAAAPAPAAPEPVQPAAAAPAAPRAARPPVLEAPPDRPLVTVLGGVAVVVLVILLGFVFPSLPAETNEVRSSNLPLTATAQEGRAAYESAGCASCHTQSVRSVVADVGLGAVSLADSNQVLGYRRLGPDLSDVGSRLEPDQIRSIVTGASHPAMPLSSESIDALVAYLEQSATSPPGEDEEESTDDGSETTDTTEEGVES